MGADAGIGSAGGCLLSQMLPRILRMVICTSAWKNLLKKNQNEKLIIKV
jgi:hypothetical protein